MRYIQSSLPLFIILFFTMTTSAQVGINEDNSSPDASAMLDVKSTSKGILIPRMTTTERTNIASPVEGLLVYDNETFSFWYYTNSTWKELGADDADSDPTNEHNTSVVLNGTDLETTDGGGTIITDLSSLQDGVDDADNDPTNEHNTTVTLDGTDLKTTDGGGTITTDLSDLKIIDIVRDADNDTKIQVEESADEDKIRFDLEGVEQFRFEGGRIHTQNNGISVFLGQNAGQNDDQTNNENVYIGYLTGRYNESASGNIGIGRSAQENHTSGNFTIAIGNYSAQKHETGANNIAMGAYSFNNNVDGRDNTAIGVGALRFDTTGTGNVAVGGFALYNGLDMDYNTAVGHYAGYNAEGDYNVFLGRNAGRSSSGDNLLYIDNSNTNSPLIYGEFDNDLLRVNGTLNSTGEISGNANLEIGTTGLIGNMGVGSESTDQGTSIATGLGYTTTPWLYTNAIEAQGERGSSSTLITLGADGTYGSGDEIHFITSGNSQMMINSSGRIGIDQSSPTTDLHIRQSQQSITAGTGGITFEESSDATDTWRIYHSGIYFSFNKGDDRVAYVTGTGAWTVDSDRTLKKNINNMPSVLDRVMQLRPVDYHYKTQSEKEGKVLGFIAQEVRPLFPEMVVNGENGKLGMTYSTAGVIAIKAIQEQQETIQQQQNEIEELKKQNNDIEQRLRQLEKLLQNTSE